MNLNELSVGDFVLAHRILKDLSRNWTDFEAYKLGLIDDKGTKIKSSETKEEKKAVSSYYRIIFNLKRLYVKMLGQSKLSRAAVTLLLLREGVNKKTVDIIESKLDIPDNLNESEVNKLLESE